MKNNLNVPLEVTELNDINGGGIVSTIKRWFRSDLRRVTPMEPVPTYSLINGRITRTGEVLIVST